MSGIRMNRVGAAVAAGLLSLSLAGPALADDDDDGRRWRHRGYPVHQHDRHCDRDGHGQRGGYYGRGDHHYGRGDHGHGYRDRGDRHHAEYGCRPCGRRWRDRDKFDRHLSRHHDVPYWAVPRVLVYVDWGWLFRG